MAFSFCFLCWWILFGDCFAKLADIFFCGFVLEYFFLGGYFFGVDVFVGGLFFGYFLWWIYCFGGYFCGGIFSVFFLLVEFLFKFVLMDLFCGFCLIVGCFLVDFFLWICCCGYVCGWWMTGSAGTRWTLCNHMLTLYQ